MLIALPVVLLGGVATEQCAPPPTPGGDPAGSGSWIATAYGPPWNAINGTGVTATGLNLTAGPPAYEIAVDPAVIPLQTFAHVQPNPFGTTRAFYAGDTGGAIIGRHVDIYDWKGRADQNAWGVRHVNVTPAPNPGSGNLLQEITPAPTTIASSSQPGGTIDADVRSARRKRDARDGPGPDRRGFSPTEPPPLPATRRRRSSSRSPPPTRSTPSRTPSRSRTSARSRPRGRRTTARAQCHSSSTAPGCTANGPTCPGRSNPGDSPGPAHGSPCTPTRRTHGS